MSSVRRKPWFKSWINDELNDVITKRNQFYKIFRKTNRQSYKNLHKLQAELARWLDKRLQHRYYTEQICNKRNSTKIFKILDQMGFGNQSRTPKSALGYFPAQDILEHVAKTYSIHPPCTREQVAQILTECPLK